MRSKEPIDSAVSVTKVLVSHGVALDERDAVGRGALEAIGASSASLQKSQVRASVEL